MTDGISDGSPYSISNCASCGGDHDGLVPEPLDRPRDLGGPETYTHVADCPENGQPILWAEVDHVDHQPLFGTHVAIHYTWGVVAKGYVFPGTHPFTNSEPPDALLDGIVRYSIPSTHKHDSEETQKPLSDLMESDAVARIEVLAHPEMETERKWIPKCPECGIAAPSDVIPEWLRGEASPEEDYGWRCLECDSEFDEPERASEIDVSGGRK